MSNQLSIFNFHRAEVRIQILNEQPLFCLKDVSAILNISNSKVSRFNLSEKGVHKMYLPTKGGKQELTFINEPNLYRVIFRSNKKEAVEFQNWVFEEVLPTIRKTGSYVLTINPEQQQAIREAVKSRTERTGEKYAAIYSRLANKFKIAKYQQLPVSKFDEAIEYLGKTDAQLTLMTNDELCILCWLCKAFELMRKNNQKLVEGLYNLKSEYAPSCYSMAFDYLSLIQRAKAILEKKTKHIKPKDEGNQADNWENVLMFIRG